MHRHHLIAYQSDASDFANVMRAYIDDLNARVEHTKLQVETREELSPCWPTWEEFPDEP